MRRLSYSGTLVTQSVARGHRYGFDVMRATNLPSGTVYPLLRRLEAAGLVTSSWEQDQDVQGEGRPRRRYYELTLEGARVLSESLERLRSQQALLGGAPPRPSEV